MEEVNYISNLPNIIKYLKKKYFETRSLNIKSLPLSNSYEEFSAKVLIIVDPIKIDTSYYCISEIWKRFQLKNSPQSKLIIMGLLNYSHPNYIDLLNIPNDIKEVIENSLTVENNLEIPIDGMDIREKLRRFFEGHGSESMASDLAKLRQTIITSTHRILSGKSSIKEVSQEILLPKSLPYCNSLINRIKKYEIFFQFLPFYSIVHSLHINIEEFLEILLKLKENVNIAEIIDLVMLDKYDSEFENFYKELTFIEDNYL